MSTLIESKCRIISDSVFSDAHAVEHGSDVSVVSDVVGRTPVYRSCGSRIESDCLRTGISYLYLREFHFVGCLDGNESGDLCLKICAVYQAFYFLPEESAVKCDFIFPICESFRMCKSGSSGCRYKGAVLKTYPEVPRGPVVVKVIR